MMPKPESAAPPIDDGKTTEGPPGLRHRRPPPMRIVTKGWWTLEERQAESTELEQADSDE